MFSYNNREIHRISIFKYTLAFIKYSAKLNLWGCWSKTIYTHAHMIIHVYKFIYIYMYKNSIRKQSLSHFKVSQMSTLWYLWTPFFKGREPFLPSQIFSYMLSTQKQISSSVLWTEQSMEHSGEMCVPVPASVFPALVGMPLPHATFLLTNHLELWFVKLKHLKKFFSVSSFQFLWTWTNFLFPSVSNQRHSFSFSSGLSFQMSSLL